MGNKVRIERICEFCGKTFIAKTCKTRFCCKACNDKYYKELIRSDRYNAVTKEVKEEKKKRIRLAVDELEVIQAREFISLKQLAIYLGVSRKSIYTYMRIYEIPFSQIGSRIIVKRKEVETVMMNLKSVKTMQERPIKSTKTITDFYSAKEIEEKYQISYSRLYVIAKENNIPSATLSGKRLFSMEHIDRYFRKLGYKEAEEITEWYTIEQIQKIYKMTVKAVHSFTSRYKTTGFAVIRPTKVNQRFLAYSLLNDDFLGEVISKSVGVSYPAINSTDLIEIKLPMPPKEEQETIASYLDIKVGQIDSAIEKMEQALENLKSYKSALITEAVTGKIDLREWKPKEENV